MIKGRQKALGYFGESIFSALVEKIDIIFLSLGNSRFRMLTSSTPLVKWSKDGKSLISFLEGILLLTFVFIVTQLID